MEIVLDTNILISSLLRNGLTRDIISVSPFKMYTVEYANLEIENTKTNYYPSQSWMKNPLII